MAISEVLQNFSTGLIVEQVWCITFQQDYTDLLDCQVGWNDYDWKAHADWKLLLSVIYFLAQKQQQQQRPNHYIINVIYLVDICF